MGLRLRVEGQGAGRERMKGGVGRSGRAGLCLRARCGVVGVGDGWVSGGY